ncbi:MFS transporter [Amycolatopsis cihanbeyliensis]
MLALPTLLISMDLTVLYMALPQLSADLGPSSTEMLWIVDIYPFVIAGFLVTMGNVGDRIGRRKLLMIGASAFGIASLLSAYSTSPEMLIGARALLGVAGATLQPSTLSLISNMFKDAKQRASAIGLWATAFTVGAIVGPVIGGILLQSFWWGSVFLLGVPVMVLLLVAAPILLPEYRAPKAAGRIDLTSVALSMAAILPIVYGFKEIARDGWGVLPIAMIVAGLGVGWVFVRRQRGLVDPLVDMKLFSSRAFSGALTMMLLMLVTLSGLTMFFTQYLQLVEGLSPFVAGLWMIPFVGGTLVGVNLAPLLVRKLKDSHVISGGLLFSAVGFLILTFVGASSGALMLAIGATIVTLGMAPLMVLGTGLVVGSAPVERSGSAAAISETSNELGMALGAAMLGSIALAVYRGQVDGSVLAGAPDQAAETAGDTLAGATTVSEQLGSGVLGVAREAFTNGFNVASGVSALIMIGLAAIGLTLLRNANVSGSGEPEGTGDAADEAAPPDLVEEKLTT